MSINSIFKKYPGFLQLSVSQVLRVLVFLHMLFKKCNFSEFAVNSDVIAFLFQFIDALDASSGNRE